ncbi:MAG: hypothetical protein DWQ31_15035 [Planctomycetota bacterium]|nr:MAG: hypothetical protein DWQ31_15035 [Planctomycetota bacterium]REK44184.1 MAG: hypothetical protein DWQ46_10625 [Planctomycetota bacterium]
MLDRAGNSGSNGSYWASGELWSFLLGLERVLPVTTYRCEICGLLQSYTADCVESTPAEARDELHTPNDHRESSLDVREQEAIA